MSGFPALLIAPGMPGIAGRGVSRGGELPPLPINSTIGFLGHSRFAARNTRGIPHQIMMRMNGRFYFNPYAIQARDGLTCTGFLAILPTLLAIRPAIVVIVPPVNDFTGSAFAGTIQPKYEAMIALCRASGARIILENEPASSKYNPTTQIDVDFFNAYVQTKIAPDLKVANHAPRVDMDNPLHSYDTEHFTEYGAWLVTEAEEEILTAWVDMTTDVMASVDANSSVGFRANLNTETDMGGSIAATSPATGTLYTGGSNQAANTGLTVAMQAADDAPSPPRLLHGEKAQRMTIGGTSNSTTNDTRMHRAQTHSFVAGDFVEAFAHIRMTAVDGVSPPGNVAGLQLATGNFGRLFDEVIVANNGIIRNVIDHLFRTNPSVFTIQASSITTEVSERVTSGLSPDAVIDMSGLRERLCERDSYGELRDQSIPGDGGAAIYPAAAATPASGAAGTVFSTTPGNVSGGGCYADSLPLPGSITYQWVNISDGLPVGVGSNETTRSWTSTGAAPGTYRCGITWTHVRNGITETITVYSNAVTVI